MQRYYVAAEHSLGKSVAHPCTDFAHEDPVDSFELDVSAADAGTAEFHGRVALEQAVKEMTHCPCGRTRMAGSESWWESVTMEVTPDERFDED